MIGLARRQHVIQSRRSSRGSVSAAPPVSSSVAPLKPGREGCLTGVAYPIDILKQYRDGRARWMGLAILDFDPFYTSLYFRRNGLFGGRSDGIHDSLLHVPDVVRSSTTLPRMYAKRDPR
ncbi:hypothetical protein M404DRAFT_1007630 [Pisolithus tinctorius Marx 270]|uniref:Uncharacterized protein n=1 Tax=Pisolithus tinctorius Marx 270 TaxID=870435 RepID=A0A0C3NI45_PISTI|nr:hypothetical protein M404DRAFT_1007630 [Pisolithus tinctorius Marx 270]